MKTILKYLCPEITGILEKVLMRYGPEILEIRLRAGNVLVVRTTAGTYYVQRSGELSIQAQGAVMISMNVLQKTLQGMCRHSLYAYESELRQGYLTLPGGHRIGVTGTAVLDDGHIQSLRSISGLNIRIARQCRGCAEPLLPWIRSSHGIHSTLLVSPPGCGKTTILRDLIRIIASEERRTISVIDERTELSGTAEGVARFDLGYSTDVLSGCPKKEGIIMMLRSMGPEILAVDEIGGKGEYEILKTALNSGVNLLCTLHGETIHQLLQKPVISNIIQDHMFPRIVFLSSREGPGTIEHIHDGDDFSVLL